MHILGYDIDINNQELNNKMSLLRDNAFNATLSVMEQIKRDYNIVFKYEDLKNLINSQHNIGRPDLAKLCIKYGYASSVQDAFDKYLNEARNKTRSTAKGLPKEECIKLITASNGIPVLAHPKTLELSEKELLILILPKEQFYINIYHYGILFFNLLPIIPLDGSKILNLGLSKYLNLKLSNKLNVFISVITILILLIIQSF